VQFSLPPSLRAVLSSPFLTCSSLFPLPSAQFLLPPSLRAVLSFPFLTYSSLFPLPYVQFSLPPSLRAVLSSPFLTRSSLFPLPYVQFSLPPSLRAVLSSPFLTCSSLFPLPYVQLTLSLSSLAIPSSLFYQSFHILDGENSWVSLLLTSWSKVLYIYYMHLGLKRTVSPTEFLVVEKKILNFGYWKNEVFTVKKASSRYCSLKG
jgi:hypothetical protein